jgi:hypothetical protein
VKLPRIRKAGFFALLLAAGCSSSEPKGADQPTASGSPDATSGTPAATSVPVATSNATGTPTATATSAPAGADEVAKDPNALILDVSVEPSTGTLAPADSDRIKTTFVGIIATSSVLAVPTSKGVTGTRRVITRLLIEPVKETKDKISVKVQINGVTKDGHCPLFDLKQKAEMDRTSQHDGDVQAVRDAAVQMILKQLETDAPKFKPNAQCVSDKPKN